jgi:hypothetical protein|tara:strand:+ start:216 stop:500 length:285 start_codon:yes stop_codon:yes gene_type:complete
MTHLVIKRDDLIYANTIAKAKNWPRHFKKHEFEDVKKFDKEQEWPIHFSIKLAKDRHRILFEHYNGELYQLDIPLSIYNNLKLLLKDKKREYLN